MGLRRRSISKILNSGTRMNSKHSSLLRLALSLCVALILSGTAESKDLTITPHLALSEQYTDNILLSTNKIDEYITRVVPGVTVEYEAPRLKFDFDGAIDYRYYANYSAYEDVQENGVGRDDTTYQVKALANAEVVKNHFNVVLQDVYERVSLDITRDYTQESLIVNQSDRNTFTLNPYFSFKLTPASTLVFGYKYVDIWYRENVGDDKNDNIGYGEIRHEVSSKSVVTAGYEYTKEQSQARDFDKHVGYLSFRHEYSEQSYVDLKVGNLWIDYSDGPSQTQFIWDAGISYRFTQISASFRTALEFIENPEGNPSEVQSYTLSLQRITGRVKPGILLYAGEYRDSITDDLDSRTYRGGVTLGYEMTQKIDALFDYTLQRIDDEQNDTYTTAYFTGIRLDFKPSEDFTLSMAYRYQYSHSPEIETDNYHSNRVILELAKRF